MCHGRNQKENKILEMNECGNATYQKLECTAKAVLRGLLIEINAFIKKSETHQINDLSMYLKDLKQQPNQRNN